MSGVFNPNEPGIIETDREDVARAHGLTEYDEESGVWRAPSSDQSDGADLQPGEDAAAAGTENDPTVGLGVQPLGDDTRPVAPGGVTELPDPSATDVLADRERRADAETNEGVELERHDDGEVSAHPNDADESA